jgi:hypothetical protein
MPAFTFFMTVTSTDGTVTGGACSDADIKRSLATAARRGYRVEVTSQGGANIRREIPGKGCHTVIYTPFRKVYGIITNVTREDLRLIDIRRAAEFQPETGRIKAGYVNSIPPATSSWLRFRGLVAVDGTTVTVSMSARLAMLARDHKPAPWAHILTPDQLAAFLAHGFTTRETQYQTQPEER